MTYTIAYSPRLEAWVVLAQGNVLVSLGGRYRFPTPDEAAEVAEENGLRYEIISPPTYEEALDEFAADA